MITPAELRAFMTLHVLTHQRVEDMLQVSHSTVKSWLAPEDAAWHRAMPANMMKLLKYEIGDDLIRVDGA